MSAETSVKVLNENMNKSIQINTTYGKIIQGKLMGFDEHMNILLDQSIEKLSDGTQKDLGNIVLRGDNVVMISPSKN